MKIFMRILLILSIPLLAQGSHPDLIGQRRAERMMNAIPEGKAKDQAGIALEAYKNAVSNDEAVTALRRLFSIDAPAAKITALIAVGYPDIEKDFSNSLSLTIEDIPLMLQWLLADAATASDGLSEYGMLVCYRLDILCNETNRVLGTEGLPREQWPRTGWEAYSSDKLRQWSITQLGSSLTRKSWSKQERDALLELIETLTRNSAEVAQPSKGNLVSSSSSDQTPKASNHDTSYIQPPSQLLASNHKWLVWIEWGAVIIVATCLLRFLLKK